jgi:(S)-mandelate dehydrogenase
MQLYVMKERAIARDIMQRAAAAGYEALVFTTDANIWGSREWDQRNYRSPGKPTLRTALDSLRHPRWLIEVLGRNGVPRFRNLEGFLPPGGASAVGGSTILPPMFEATITWDDIAWIREYWKGKLLIKGVLNAADAERALALGCDGIVITNHGGRQLDHCVATIEVLPQIAAAVGGRLPLVIDSGFRRGTDIVKALALGAEAVQLGRAVVYGLGAGGSAGVDRALQILTTEMTRALGLLGCNSVAELGPQHLRHV